MSVIYICDNEPAAAASIERILRAKLEDAELSVFPDYGSMTASIDNRLRPVPDILISDIALDDANGCDEAGTFAAKYPDTKIIFVTGYPELAKDIFKYITPHGLVFKPIDENELLGTIDRAMRDDAVLTIHNRAGVFKLRLSDILYVESSLRRLNFIIRRPGTVTGTDTVTAAMTLTDFLDQYDGFIQCHKSFAANFSKILRLSRTELELIDGSNVPVSRNYYQRVFDALFTKNE